MIGARAAIGVAALPRDASVEMDGILELADIVDAHDARAVQAGDQARQAQGIARAGSGCSDSAVLSSVSR